MKRYNVILLLDAAGEHVLMCRRMKPPFAGLLNLVGGKAEPLEDGLHAAYRELREETGVTAADTLLTHAMTFFYPAIGAGTQAIDLAVYAGRLRRQVAVAGEENPLAWVPVTENFFDGTRFSGDGNIGHMLASVRAHHPELLEIRAAHVTLTSLSEEDLPVLAFYQRCAAQDLQPMLKESLAREHEGCYYEQFAIRVDGCMVGLASLYEHGSGVVSDGVEVFGPFRRCGFATRALMILMDAARQRGFRTMTAQVRTENAASIALHRRAGFAVTGARVNRRGNEVHDMEKALTKPVRHEMSLRPKPFAKITSGEKTYELRLHDEKRQAIRIGDEILFTCTADERTVLTRVTGLHPFADFAALYAALPLTRCGYKQEDVHNADPRDMEVYYPPEKQAKYGVVAIELTRVRYDVAELSGKFTVRELTASDVPEMLRLALGNPLYYEHMHIRPDEVNIAQTLTALPPCRTLADKHIFGWFEGDHLIALMDLIARHPQEDMAFIGWFMVDAARQGCGLGRSLVADVLAMLAAQGVREVRLGRVTGNRQSEAFWRACGFEDTELGYDAQAYRVTVMKKVLV